MAAPGRQQHQGRAEALASCGEEVGHRGRDDVGIAVYLVTETRLDRGEIGDHRAEDVYVVWCSQIRTSSASTASPNRVAAISSKCFGKSVARTSWRWLPPVARRRECSRCRLTLAAVGVAESIRVKALGYTRLIAGFRRG